MHKLITSTQNPIIKATVLLQEKSRERRKQELFVVEGKREITLALEGAYRLKTIFYLPELITSDFLAPFDASITFIEVSKQVYEKLAYRNTEGILAVAHTKDMQLDSLSFSTKNPLVLVAESPEKPGNIGALLRTADAANLDAVIIIDPKTDLYNPNVIRSSVGCLFTNQIAIGTVETVLNFLEKHTIQTYAAALRPDAAYYQEQDFTAATALIVGTESTGLSSELLEKVDKTIIIPMQGKIDSMNVSVAAGILVFEAKRQRGFN